MSVRIHLVRHGAHGDVGRVLSGRDGSGLTPEGRAQVERLAATMDVPVAIYSSPRRRARETAAIVAIRHGVGVEIAPALDEVDFGEWTGLGFDALRADPRWLLWNERRAASAVPGGETMAAATARIVGHLDGFANRALQAAIICVSHCDMIRGAIAHYLGLSLDNLLRFQVDPASISTIEIGPWGGRVLTVNRVYS
jgi:ribonuclease H / adenosylcobalamin/alpha-ribazole phosphatase